MRPWFPVALAADLGPSEVAGTRLFGREIALWRDESGAVHAWEDRCPHRGMRLSLGFVRGDALACLYHGWRWGTEGGCRAIPAHPDLRPPSTLRVARHAAAEARGLIWATAEPVESAPAPPQDAPAQPVRSVTLPVGAEEAHALLARHPLDPALHVAVQPLAAGESALHAVRPGPPAPPETLVPLARALARLRDAAGGA